MFENNLKAQAYVIDPKSIKMISSEIDGFNMCITRWHHIRLY